MNQKISNRFRAQRASKIRVANRTLKLASLLTIALFMFSCGKQNPEKASQGDVAGKKGSSGTTSSQPLPQGKANFSVTLGNMDSTPWVRLGNWTFNATAGTVAATFWTWFEYDKHDVQVLNTHTCTFDGVTKTVNAYTPYGWGEPAGVYMNWSGTYVYNTSTGRLNITWTSGAGAGNSESWDVSLPETGLARVKFVSGSSTYNVTHGRGYGSNASWSTYKTIDTTPDFVVTGSTGRRVQAKLTNGTTFTVSPTGTSAWESSSWGFSGFTTPSSPTPKNAKHYWHSTADTPCDPASTNPSCTTTRPGIVYHLASRNGGRQMSWVNFCACLPSNTSWPGYNGNMHPHAFQQIINDSGTMRGVIGVEVQNPPSGGSAGGYPNYQLQLEDFTLVPGS